MLECEKQLRHWCIQSHGLCKTLQYTFESLCIHTHQLTCIVATEDRKACCPSGMLHRRAITKQMRVLMPRYHQADACVTDMQGACHASLHVASLCPCFAVDQTPLALQHGMETLEFPILLHCKAHKDGDCTTDVEGCSIVMRVTYCKCGIVKYCSDVWQ